MRLWITVKCEIMVTEKIRNTLQKKKNNFSDAKIMELERSIHKLEIYSVRECAQIARTLRDILNVTLEDVVNKLLNKRDVKLTNNDLVDCHKLANSDRTIIKVNSDRTIITR